MYELTEIDVNTLALAGALLIAGLAIWAGLTSVAGALNAIAMSRRP